MTKHLVGGLSYLYQATGNTSYLSYAGKIARTSIKTFAPNGVAEELCEATSSCNQDQQGFKVISPFTSLTLHQTSKDETDLAHLLLIGHLPPPTGLPIPRHPR